MLVSPRRKRANVSGQLEGRRILITGAATGIGAAAVKILGAEGARIAATFHNTPPPDDVDADWYHCDVCDQPSVDTAFQNAVAALGGLDVLVHAAGLWHPGIPGHIDETGLALVIDTNFTSTVLTNQAAYQYLRNDGGAIINFGSAEAVLGSPISAIYAAAKGAVQAWTRSIARAWAGQRITANALAPAVETPGAQRLRAFLGPDAKALIDQQLKATIPLGGKLGDPTHDLGPALIFLASSGAHFITGQLIAVDGGLMMLGG